MTVFQELAEAEFLRHFSTDKKVEIAWHTVPFPPNHLTCFRGTFGEWTWINFLQNLTLVDAYAYTKVDFEKVKAETRKHFDEHLLHYISNMFDRLNENACKSHAFNFDALKAGPHERAKMLINIIVNRGMKVPKELHNAFANLDVQV